MRLLLLSAFVFTCALAEAQDICLTAEEKKLYDLIMQYRKSKHLKSIPLSIKLTRVAQTHVRDLDATFNDAHSEECNAHSWSDQGQWTPCCYTQDHSQAACMWNKPREITGYDGEGYEIAYIDPRTANAAQALKGWKESRHHNPLLINSETWKDSEWKAIGIGLYGKYGAVWFGEVEDKGKVKMCGKK